jgi:undecaprenyl-diphosphatase
MPRLGLEIELVRWIASLGGRSWWIDHIALALVTSPLFRAVPCVAILSGYWAATDSHGRGPETRRQVLVGFVSSGAALVLSRIIQNVFQSLRPINDPMFAGLFHESFNRLDFHSFPSDHAAMLVPLVCAIGALQPLAGVAMGLLLTCGLLARIWSGLHYPTDVLAGALLGLTVVWSVRLRPDALDRCLDLLDRARRRGPVTVATILFLIAFLYASMFESVREFVEHVVHALWH